MRKNIIILAAAVLAFSSCSDILDKAPASKLSPETYFKTATDLQLFTNPLYNNLLPKTFYNEQSDQYIKSEPSDLVKGKARIVPASGGNWTWTDLRRINTCLDYIPKQCEDENAAVQYSALCKFFRTYLYFDKVAKFGDVPWIDHELGSNDEMLYAPRDSREVVMTHMIEDIDEAIAGLPSSYGSLNYRATKWAALALKARFCLYEGTYRKYHNISYPEHDYKYYLQLAYEAADELMKEGPFKLYSTGNPDLDYAVLFSEYEANTGEMILAINFDSGIALCHNATAVALMNSQGRTSLTKKFVNCYLMKDGSRFTDKDGWETMQFAEETADRDPRLGQTIRIPGYARITESGGAYSYSETKQGVDPVVTLTGYQMAKFVMPDNNQALDKFDKSYNDLAIFRLAEVYLNYAEAKAEYGNITQDDIDRSINLLRDRVGMPHLSVAEANANPDPYLLTEEFYPDLKGADNAGILLEIRRERAVELAQEGLRYDDLMRWHHGEHLASPYLGIYFPGPGVYDIDGDGTNDYYLYTGTKDASVKATVTGQLDKDIFLSNGTSGNLWPHANIQGQFYFDQERDYLYPIPINDRTLNPNLTQNPGWDDGLNY
ncbi:MAG: RagB/SusD family nutrient uptake outer membrane protein [Candidatus Cryptobacteroides sp.]